jgi:hypothetical protein
MRALLASAFITYMSSAPEDVRHDCLESWMEFVGVTGFDLRHFLSTESEQLIWKGEGLPSDDLSTENAMVILQVKSHFCFDIQICVNKAKKNYFLFIQNCISCRNIHGWYYGFVIVILPSLSCPMLCS